MTDRAALRSLIDTVVDNIEASRPDDAPFYHLQFDKVFPDDIYAEMVDALPVSSDYRAAARAATAATCARTARRRG